MREVEFFVKMIKTSKKNLTRQYLKKTNDKEAEKQDKENAKEEKATEFKEPSTKKRRSNIEKSLEVVLNQFKETSKDDFER